MATNGSIPPNLGFGSFVPSTNVWEIQQIQEANLDPKVKEILIRLYQNLNLISVVLNTKDTGIYDLSEFVNGQLFFPNPSLNSSTPQSPTYRQPYRIVINFGALPNATTKSVAHGLTIQANWTLTRLYGAATNPNTEFIPIPYASATDVAHNIELNMDTANINITTGANYSAYTVCYVVIEYLKY